MDPSFVIQHHLASSDHYDLRLEIAGVLVSWAVPKGPSLDPSVSRLAIRTGDHELAHASVEGRGHGGGPGVVQVWDRGTFRNTSHDRHALVSAREGLQQGRLSFELAGAKLRGGFALIRTDNGGRQEQWLLTKKRDREADAVRDPVRDENRSVLSGLTMEEIAAADE